jgi:hypothetical protein
MSSHTAPRCRHIKVSGARCGSPALRLKSFCFYHQDNRPWKIECYSDGEYATGEVLLPFFEDAHSIQAVLREVVQMVLQKRIERKTASLLLYALQIASSNLKRIELEKPQPEQVVIDVVEEEDSDVPIAGCGHDAETARESSDSAQPQPNAPAIVASTKTGAVEDANLDIPRQENKRTEEGLPPGTIQACHRPGPFIVSARKRREKAFIPSSAPW